MIGRNMKDKINNVEDLIVYKKLSDLTIEIHDLSLKFPKFELYELGSQIRRSSNSIPANIAEGFNNKHINLYLEGISRALGELRETKHHLKIAFAKKYISKNQFDHCIVRYDECARILKGLEKSLFKFT
jgi:four helix bundle protein